MMKSQNFTKKFQIKFVDFIKSNGFLTMHEFYVAQLPIAMETREKNILQIVFHY